MATTLLPSLAPHNLWDKSPFLGARGPTWPVTLHPLPSLLYHVKPTHATFCRALNFPVLHPPPGAPGIFRQPTPFSSLSRSHGPAPGSWYVGGDMDPPWEVSESKGGDRTLHCQGSEGEDTALAHKVSSEGGTEPCSEKP